MTRSVFGSSLTAPACVPRFLGQRLDVRCVFLNRAASRNSVDLGMPNFVRAAATISAVTCPPEQRSRYRRNSSGQSSCSGSSEDEIMRDITVDRPVDQSHFECNVCPWKSHLKRKVLHFNLTQHIETTNGVSPYSNINRQQGWHGDRRQRLGRQ